MDVMEKLIELLDDFPVQMEWHNNDELAEYLIANGVTVDDSLSPTEPLTNCQKWIPLPEPPKEDADATM